MPFWHRIVIAVAVFLVVSLLARLVDWWLVRRPLPPEAATRYRVLRRTISVAIIVVGLFSALLVIPQVRAVAGGLLASSAVLGVIIGFASQRTLGNFVAGLLIAITQPVRLGDRVSYAGRGRHRRGDRPHVHVHPHGGSGAARRPEREARLRYDPQLDDPQPGDVRRDHGADPAFSRSRRGRRRASRRGRGRARCRRST